VFAVGGVDVSAVSGVVHGLVVGDVSLAQQVGEGIIHGVHAIGGTDLDQPWQLFGATFADDGADAGVGFQDFAGEDSSRDVTADEESLGDDADQHAGDLRTDLGLLIAGEGINEAIDGLAGID